MIGARCTGPRANPHAYKTSSRRALSQCPHAYLTPLLTDECQSTVGPQGWVPQHCVLTSGTDRERGERVLATCLALATYKGEWSSNVIGRLSFAMSALATRSSIFFVKPDKRHQGIHHHVHGKHVEQLNNSSTTEVPEAWHGPGARPGGAAQPGGTSQPRGATFRC